MVAVDIESRGERAQIGRIAWSVGEFETAIRRLHDLTAELKAIGDDYRWRGGGAIDLGDPDFS